MKKFLIILAILISAISVQAKEMIKLNFKNCYVTVNDDTTGTHIEAKFNVFVSDKVMKIRCPKYPSYKLLNFDFEVTQFVTSDKNSFFVEYLNHGFEGSADYSDRRLFIVFTIGDTKYSVLYWN